MTHRIVVGEKRHFAKGRKRQVTKRIAPFVQMTTSMPFVWRAWVRFQSCNCFVLEVEVPMWDTSKDSPKIITSRVGKHSTVNMHYADGSMVCIRVELPYVEKAWQWDTFAGILSRGRLGINITRFKLTAGCILRGDARNYKETGEYP